MSAAEIAIGEAEVAADLMLRRPKTLPGDASVALVRAQLANPKVQMVLLADGEQFVGAVTSIPAAADSHEPAADYADSQPDTIDPMVPAREAFERAVASPYRRVIVLDGTRRLLGLLCLNPTRTAFCQVPSSRADAGRPVPESA
jgi:hypothetical protein